MRRWSEPACASSICRRMKAARSRSASSPCSSSQSARIRRGVSLSGRSQMAASKASRVIAMTPSSGLGRSFSEKEAAGSRRVRLRPLCYDDRQRRHFMTEEDWLACTDPEVMLLVAARDSERKQRLCATGLARLVLGHFLRGTTAAIQRLSAWLTSRRWLAQLDAAEEFADGSIDQKALIAARSESGGPYNFFLQVCRTTPSNLVFLANTLKALQEEFGVPSPAEVCYLFRE